MYDFKLVQTQSEWLQSKAGKAMLNQKKRLVETLLTGWGRRGHSVLDVACGTGLFLETLWESGFDPTGVESHPELLDAVRKHLGSKVDLHLAKPDSLPFEEDEFDYVTLTSGLDFLKDPAPVLAEAFRVAAKGMLVMFSNRWSIACLQSLFGRGVEYMGNIEYFSLPKILSPIKKLDSQIHFTFRSTLLGPSSSWREKSALFRFNNIITFMPFGACAGVRIDFEPRRTGTLLPLSTNYDPVLFN